MQEKHLFIPALACAIIGISIILIISETAEIPKIQISQINYDMLDREVKITANVTKVKNTPGLLIAEITDSSGAITMIAYNEEKIYLQQNQQIEVIGKIAEYGGQLEIKASYIRLTNQ